MQLNTSDHRSIYNNQNNNIVLHIYQKVCFDIAQYPVRWTANAFYTERNWGTNVVVYQFSAMTNQPSIDTNSFDKLSYNNKFKKVT